MSKLWPPERADRFCTLWASDLPTPVVAAEMGMNLEAVYARAKSFGLGKRHAKRAAPQTSQDVFDMRQPCMRSTYAAQTAELFERYVALSLKVQARRAA